MQIYGIDISSAHLDVYSQDHAAKPIVKRISNKFTPIVKFLSCLPPDSVLCAEHTGIYGNLLVQLTNSYGFKIALIEGYVISKSFAMEKGKSDLIDAKRIWSYGVRFYDKLRFTTAAQESMHELKELLNLRNLLVKQRKMIKTNFKGKEKQIMNGIKACQIQHDLVDFLTQQIIQIDHQMRLIIAQNQALDTNYNLVASVVGIGQVTTTELIVHTENFTKIDSAKKAASFSGVCPFPNQSGNKSSKPRVPKRSNKRMKSLLFLAAISACNANKEFKLYKERKTMEGKHFFLVMNNVANKLLRTIFAVVRSGQPYDPMYMAKDPRIT